MGDFNGVIGDPEVKLLIQGVDVLPQEVQILEVVHYELHHRD
jgi:hypothetical protein